MKRRTKVLAGAGLLALALGLPAALVARGAQQDAPETEEETEEELEEFEPTEKVNADEAISFPVDI